MKLVTRKFLLRTSVAVALLGLGGSPLLADAATSTTQLQVSVNVPSSCTVSATPLSFANYVSGQGSNDDTTATVTASCTSSISVTITADMGQNAAGTQRKVSNGTHMLNYNIFTDAGFANIWGDGTNSTSTFTGTAASAGTQFTARGRIPSGQPADANTTYTDIVIVTVNF